MRMLMQMHMVTQMLMLTQMQMMVLLASGRQHRSNSQLEQTHEHEHKQKCKVGLAGSQATRPSADSPSADSLGWRTAKRRDHLRTVWAGGQQGGATSCGQFGLVGSQAARPYADSLGWRA